MRDAAYFAIAFFCSAFIVLRFLTSSSCVLTLGRLAIAPPCTLVRRPFSSIVIKSRRTVDSEASSAVISSCIVALPSASIMDSILENRSSASICLTPLFSFSFTIFQNRSFDGSYYSYIFCHRQSLSVKIIHKNRTGILCIMSFNIVARKDRAWFRQRQSGSYSWHLRGCRNFYFNYYQADATGGHSPSGLSDHLPRTSMYEAC